MTLLVLLPLLLGQTHSRWETAVQTEVRVRSATLRDRGGAPALCTTDVNCDGTQTCVAGACVGSDGRPAVAAAGDLEIHPRAVGELFSGPWTLTGRYSPIVRVREPYFAPRAEHSHTLQADGSWAREGSARVFAGEYFNYGTLDLTTTRPTETVTDPNAVGVVEEITTDTSFGVDWYLSRTLTLTTSGGYLFGGGANPASQERFPLQSAPRGLARLQWGPTRYDTFGLTTQVRFSSFQTGTQVGIAELSGRWARLLTEDTTLELTAGVTGSWGRVPSALTDEITLLTGVAPMGGAGLTHRLRMRGQQLDLGLSAQVAPYVDRFLGTSYERAEASGGLLWSNVHRFSAYLRLGVTRAFTEGGLFTTFGAIGAGYQGADWWRVDLAGRQALLSRPADADGNPQPFESQWVVGLSATFIAVSEPTAVLQE